MSQPLKVCYLRKKVDAMRAAGSADSQKIASVLEEIGRLKAERATVAEGPGGFIH